MARTNQTLRRDGHGTGVNTSTVERTRARLRREMNPPHTTEHAHPPPRTSVLNLVIHAPDRAAVAQAVRTLGQLAQRHLSRTVVITEDPAAAEPGLDARVTTRCQIRPLSARQICLEEVRKTTRGTPATHRARIVALLLLADFPVVLWWLGEPPEPGAHVLDLADQLIVDSRSFTATGFGRFALLVGAEGNRLRFADLAWSATDRWRELLARLFDPVEARSYQPTIGPVQLDHHRGPPAQPLRLVGWLASRLGWSFGGSTVRGESDSIQRRFHRRDGHVDVVLHAVAKARAAEPGDLLVVALTSQQTEWEGTFEIARLDDGARARRRTQLAGQSGTTSVVPLTSPPEAATLSRVLGQLDRDSIDETSVATAGRIAE